MVNTMTEIQSICFLGFGEVGNSLAASLCKYPSVSRIRAYDIQCDHEKFIERNSSSWPTIEFVLEPEAAVRNVDLVISAVTAAQDLIAAQSVARALPADCWFLDLNSVAPRTKQAVDEVISKAGGRYVEAAIMSPIAPRGVGSPILIGGPQAEYFLPLAQRLGFSAMENVSSEVGKVSASKMCRSVIIKGMESLLTESLISARFYGVEKAVLDSLQSLIPGVDWEQQSAYMISRSVVHGTRRAEEMREAHNAVVDAGLPGKMSGACAEMQEWTGRFEQCGSVDGGLMSMLDEFRNQL